MLAPIAGGLFVASLASLIARQVMGRGPPLWTILTASGIATVALGVLSPADAAGALFAQLPVFVFLAALFVLARALEGAGAIDRFARYIAGRARRTVDLPLWLFVGFGAVSAFLLNDALVLIGVPLFLALSRRLGVDPRPLLLTLAYAVTVGSMLTPMGNPQNLLVALGSGLSAPVAVFLRYLLLPTAGGLLVGGLYLRWAFRPSLEGSDPPVAAAPRIPLVPPGPWGPRLREHPVVAVFPASMLVMVGASVFTSLTGIPTVPVEVIAALAAILLLAISPDRLVVLERVDWTILVLFAGLFLFVAGAERSGLLGSLEALLPLPGPSAPRAWSVLPIALGAVVGSQLVSNVPWVALQIPLLHAAGYGASSPVAWMALAGGSTLAGNLTVLGAASNLIVLAGAERHGVRIRLGTFVRYGAPLTAVTVAILWAALSVGL